MLDYTNPKLLIPNLDDIESSAVAWRSPSNIALIKYWGKHGRQLPKNPSISFTLENAYTETYFEYAPKLSNDGQIDLDFTFDGEPHEAFAKKIIAFLESLLPIFPFLGQLKLTIDSGNSFPHSAGIASSASSMSALALCLCTVEDELLGTLEGDEAFHQKASYIARLGSGSACRSIYGTMAVWGETPLVKGSSDFHAVAYEEVHPVFQHFQNDILLVSTDEKVVSSRVGHSLMENNPYANARFQQASKHLADLLPALASGDLMRFGQIVEDEALTLHALMMTSNPSFILMQPNSLEIIQHIRHFRKETGHPVFFTLDAGPNVHLLYPEHIIHEVRPFVDEILAPLCEDNMYIPDFVGEGPG
ncbi:MAG: diphosphomevalonate decarboxylase, partial [Saprospiraceae bacterium]|nr:diphosphomevalonate decarboxylase [Saprospiraceae bacterium]